MNVKLEYILIMIKDNLKLMFEKGNKMQRRNIGYDLH